MCMLIIVYVHCTIHTVGAGIHTTMLTDSSAFGILGWQVPNHTSSISSMVSGIYGIIGSNSCMHTLRRETEDFALHSLVGTDKQGSFKLGWFT